MNSIWKNTYTIKARETLTENLTTDTVIIGAGMAGILLSYRLKERGIDNIVLEAGRIAGGQTGNTTAKITAQHGLIYSKLTEQIGMDKAKQYADVCQKAVLEYRSLIEQNQIDCDFKTTNSYLYSKTDGKTIKKEYDAAAVLGLPVSLGKAEKLPFETEAAVCMHNQAMFHPLKFIGGICENLSIYENTRVKEVFKNGVRTDSGVVEAKHIVFACHYPFLVFPGFYFARMHKDRSHVLALEHAAELDGMYFGIDAGSYSFRNYDNLLLFGGENHRTGEEAEDKFAALSKAAKAFYPDAAETARWAAEDCITTDAVPFIGRLSRGTPNYFIASGFMKWGMTGSMVAADLLADLICGEKNEYESLFSPDRFGTKDIKETFKNGIKAVSGLTKSGFYMPSKSADEIEPGTGAIVEINKEKYGVYKSPEGELFPVTTACPHMGCQLVWNQEEKSWDCPCHGSRFDYKGDLLDNPANEGIRIE